MDAAAAAAASPAAAPAIGIKEHGRRNTELLLLCIAAVPVLLLYAMYLVNSNAQLSLTTLGVPIGLFAAFAAAHLAIRFLAPGPTRRFSPSSLFSREPA